MRCIEQLEDDETIVGPVSFFDMPATGIEIQRSADDVLLFVAESEPEPDADREVPKPVEEQNTRFREVPRPSDASRIIEALQIAQPTSKIVCLEERSEECNDGDTYKAMSYETTLFRHGFVLARLR